MAWKDVKIGDIVKVECDQAIPADLLLLHSSEAKGSLYIETKNLDGETNLKNKQVHKDLVDKFQSQDLADVSLKVQCETPNKAIYKFEGKIDYRR